MTKKEYQKKWHKENKPKYYPVYGREWHLKNKYGITVEDYDKMLMRQNGKCAICATREPGGSGKHFMVDHDHSTGKVRGLLCGRCNRGIGILDEDTGRLLSAVEYLSASLFAR